MKKLFTLIALLAMAVSGAWAEEVRTEVYSNDFETSSDWTIKGKTTGTTLNPGTTTVNTFNSSVLYVGNSADGDKGMVTPSLNIATNKVVDVEMKFKMDACTGGKSSGIEFITSDVNINNGWVASGTPLFSINASASGNGYWGSIMAGGVNVTSDVNIAAATYEDNNLNRNSTGLVVLNLRLNFIDGEATFSLKRTNGTTLVASTTVALQNTNATTLDRIFVHAGKQYGGVTIDDVKVYTVEGAVSKNVSSLKVEYKCGGNVVASENLSTTGLEIGNSYTAPFRQYVFADGKLYKANNNGTDPYYGEVVTLQKNTVVSKSVTEQNLNGGTVELFADLDDTDAENASVRASYRSAYNNKAYSSPNDLPSGIYKIIYKAQNKGRGSSIKIGNTTVASMENDFGTTKGTWKDITVTNVFVPVGGKLSLVAGSGRTIDCYDVIIAIKTGEATVPVTIGPAGFATFVAPYNVDFTGNAIEAFAVSAINANTVTLANVTTVPAGEAVIVRGATGTVNVVASAGAITNLMKAATQDIVYDADAANINYVLAQVEGNIGLYPVNKGTIAAGRGYLPVPKVSANSKGFEFVEDNATDAGVVEATPVAVKNGKYTENGQIVIFINGKKYNVAGMNK